MIKIEIQHDGKTSNATAISAVYNLMYATKERDFFDLPCPLSSEKTVKLHVVDLTWSSTNNALRKFAVTKND